MDGEPLIMELKLPGNIVVIPGTNVRLPKTFCMVLPCANYAQAKIVLEAFKDFQRQLIQHLKEDGK